MKTLVKTTWITWKENDHYNSIKTYSDIIAKALIDEILKQELHITIDFEFEQIDVPFDEA